MGKATYQDEPPRSSSASTYSLQPFHDDAVTDLPPSYTEADAPQINAPFRQPVSSAAFLPDPGAYAIPGGKLFTSATPGSRTSTLITVDPGVSSNPYDLWRLIREKAALPPRPYVLVKGTHMQTVNDGKGGKKKDTVVDFEFNLDVAGTVIRGWKGDGMPPSEAFAWHTTYVVRDHDGEKAHRGGRLRSKKPGKYNWSVGERARGVGIDEERGEGGYVDDEDEDEAVQLISEEQGMDNSSGEDSETPLEHEEDDNLLGWCKRFCADPAPVKSFTLTRDLHGFSSDSLQNSITSHLRAINYRGHITVSTTLSEASVTIYSPHWINRARNNTFIFWTCLILQLWLITWPIIFLLERRYHVVFSNWYASVVITGSDPDRPNDPNGMIRRKVYARDRDEVALMDFWAPAIKHAAWTRRRGEIVSEQDVRNLAGLTDEDVLRGGRGGADSDAERERRERVNRGQGTWADSFVGVVRGVSEVRSEWNRAVGWGADC